MDTASTRPVIYSKTDLIVMIVLFSVLWGLSETVLGNLMRMTEAPLRATVATGVGMGIMGCFLGILKKPLMLPFIALLAAASVQLSAPILHCSLMCKANANLAVILHGMMLFAMSVASVRAKGKGVFSFAAAGFAAALLSSAAFYHMGLRLAPCPYLLSFSGHGGFVHFLTREGIPWAGFSAILFPAGVLAGNRLQRLLSKMRFSYPRQFYGGASAFIVTGLLVIAVTVQYWR